MSIRIAGWHVDGFGVLHDYRVEAIPPGLTVFTGPNEAGKSTLLAFIRTMLFGFPPGTVSDRHYPPLRGGQHGGQLSLADSNGEVYTIDRRPGRRPPTLTRQEATASVDDLHRLLGGSDRQLFQSVFAFDLADLQELEGLNNAEVRERLALVGLTGSGESPSMAISTLERRRSIADLASGSNGIADLQRRLEDVKRSLQVAHVAAEEGKDLRTQELAATELVTARGREIDALQARRQRLQALVHAWPDWKARASAERQRSDLTLDDTIQRLAADVETVSRELDAYLVAVNELPSQQSAREDAEHSLAARLRDLGPDWDQDRLLTGSDPEPDPREADHYAFDLDRANTELTEATRAVIAARAELTEVDRRTAEAEARRSALAAVAGDRSIDERRVALRRLRARRSDLTSAEVQLQIDRTSLEGLEEVRLQAERPTAYVPPGWLIAIALAVLIVAAIGAIILFTNDDTLIGLVVTAAVVGGLVLGLVIRSRTDRAERERKRGRDDVAMRVTDARTALEHRRAHLTTLRDEIASHAAALGITPRPSHVEIEDAGRRLVEAEDANREMGRQADEIAHLRSRATTLSGQIASARTERDRAVASHAKLKEDWRAWRSRFGLPDALDPRAAKAFLTLVGDGRQKAQAVLTLESELTAAEAAVARFETKLVALAASIEIPDDEARENVAGVLTQLEDRVAQDRDARQSAARLDREIQQATERVYTVAGSDASVWEELAAGDLGRWWNGLAAAEAQIDTLEEERLALARASGEAQIERQAIERSDAVPTLNLQRTMLEAELETALRERHITTLAESLIRETVRRIEQERQPEVLRRASTLFARITVGRYQRVFRPVEGAGLEIEDNDERTRPPDALSRGTLEQLYVALRLGLAESFTDKVGALPLIMDDVLVNFDPERALGVARALFDVSRGRQVLLFTSQPATVAMLDQISDEYGHFAMERHGTGGAWIRHR